MTNRIMSALVVLFTAAGCQPPSQLKCGDGTRTEGGVCVTTIRCAGGTHEEGGECVADASINCGMGTHLEDGACVIDGLPIDSPSPWSAPVPVCSEGLACHSPKMLQTPQGALVLVAETSSLALTVAVYRETTAGFVLAKRFEGTDGVAMTPSIAMRGSTLYLAYTDYEPSGGQSYGRGDLMLATSADFGATWSSPTRINPMPATSLLHSPGLTVSEAGLDIFYMDTDGRSKKDGMYIHSDDDGLTFSAPMMLPAGSAYDTLTLGFSASRVGDLLEIPVLRSGYDTINGGQLTWVEVLTVKPGPTTHTSRVKRVYRSNEFNIDPVPVLDVSASGVRCLAYVDAPSRDFGIFVVRSETALDGTQRPVLLPGHHQDAHREGGNDALGDREAAGLVRLP
jgi:hypothetical protein